MPQLRSSCKSRTLCCQHMNSKFLPRCKPKFVHRLSASSIADTRAWKLNSPTYLNLTRHSDNCPIKSQPCRQKLRSLRRLSRLIKTKKLSPSKTSQQSSRKLRSNWTCLHLDITRQSWRRNRSRRRWPASRIALRSLYRDLSRPRPRSRISLKSSSKQRQQSQLDTKKILQTIKTNWSKSTPICKLRV